MEEAKEVPLKEIQRDVGKEPEILPNEQLVNSAVKFAEYLTSRWPQVNDVRRMTIEVDDQGTTVELPELPPSMTTEPRLNYYFVGSLATMLLSKANPLVELDETKVPSLVESRTVKIPEAASTVLASFARPIGDLDFVPIEVYKRDPNRLKKGGGGPSFDEIPEDARAALVRGENQIKLMCDPVESYGPQRVARITVDNHDYYIARPDTILGYKILHILQNYEQKPEKFNTDFSKLLRTMKAIYTDDQLLQTTYQILGDYEDTMRTSHERYWSVSQGEYQPKLPGMTSKVLAHSKTSPDIKVFLGSIQQLDNGQRGLLRSHSGPIKTS